MRQSPARKHIFPIEHDIYEVDRPENRLIKTALEVVCKKTRSSKNWKLAQELRLMTGEIPKSQNIAQDFKQWQSGRLLALYADIKPWTELILSEYMPVSTQGGWRGMSLLFPMERLFEHYVAYHLRRSLKDWKVKTQVSSQHMCTHENRQIFKLKPDIYIEKQNKKIVLDTKWKLLDQNNLSGRYGLKDSDIQQMFAYSHHYLQHSSEVVLIYPYRRDRFNRPLPSFTFNATESRALLKVLPFNLDKPDDMKKYILAPTQILFE
jgi:5-methylcytosine-specific restriction enzyme subunit McrC